MTVFEKNVLIAGKFGGGSVGVVLGFVVRFVAFCSTVIALPDLCVGSGGTTMTCSTLRDSRIELCQLCQLCHLCQLDHLQNMQKRL